MVANIIKILIIKLGSDYAVIINRVVIKAIVIAQTFLLIFRV